MVEVAKSVPTEEADRRTVVLESALRTFARYGYRKTSMEEVARDADISRPGLYFLFASKQALFGEAVERSVQEDLAAVERALGRSDEALAQRLLHAFDHWAGKYVGPLTRDLAAVVDDNPDLLGPIATTAPRRFAQLIIAALSTSPDDGVAERVAQTLISTSVGLKHQAKDRPDYLRALQVAIDLLLASGGTRWSSDQRQPVADDTRAPRRDAVANRERIVEAALRVFAAAGLQAPLAAITTEAGVGPATFYRSFVDRDALLGELERRAYAALIDIIDDLESNDERGLAAIEQFLLRSLDLEGRLVLPLHGAPPLTDPRSIADRQRIDGGLQGFLDQARAGGQLGVDANATDVIICSALITQPLQHGPDWHRSARRHVALFVAGLTGERELPGPPVLQSDLELRWAQRSRT